MSAGLFQRLFAAAEGSLQGTRVRPQVVAAGSDAAFAIEPARPEAAVAYPTAAPGGTDGALPRTAAPAMQPLQASTTTPTRLEPPRTDTDARAGPSLLRPAVRSGIDDGFENGAAQARDAAAHGPGPTAPLEPELSRAAPRQAQRHAAPAVSPLAGAAPAHGTAAAPPPLLPPASPPFAQPAPLSRPNAALRAAPSLPSATAADEPTVVHVSIGRVEFLANAPPSPRPRPAPRASTRVPLADYLSGKAR